MMGMGGGGGKKGGGKKGGGGGSSGRGRQTLQSLGGGGGGGMGMGGRPAAAAAQPALALPHAGVVAGVAYRLEALPAGDIVGICKVKIRWGGVRAERV